MLFSTLPPWCLSSLLALSPVTVSLIRSWDPVCIPIQLNTTYHNTVSLVFSVSLSDWMKRFRRSYDIMMLFGWCCKNDFKLKYSVLITILWWNDLNPSRYSEDPEVQTHGWWCRSGGEGSGNFWFSPEPKRQEENLDWNCAVEMDEPDLFQKETETSFWLIKSSFWQCRKTNSIEYDISRK